MNENNDPLFEHTWEQDLHTVTVDFNKIFSKDVHRIRCTPSAIVIELKNGLEFIGSYMYPVDEVEYIYDDHLILEIFKKEQGYIDQIFPESTFVDISKIQPKRQPLSAAPKDLRPFIEEMINKEFVENENKKKIVSEFIKKHPELDFSEMEVNWK